MVVFFFLSCLGRTDCSIEWTLLQALRSHSRNRLRYKLDYQPLEPALQTNLETTLDNAVGFFDTGMRNILDRGDLDDSFITSELGLGSQNIQAQLKSLYSLLDKLVDISLPLSKQSQTGLYRNLQALTNLLGNSL